MPEFVRKCPQCNCDRYFKNKNSFKNSQGKVCSKCAAKNRNYTGEKNPFYGKKHSKKTKDIMSKNHADFTGENNPFKKAAKNNPDIIKKLSETKKKLWEGRDDEYKKDFGSKLSIAHSKSKTKPSYKNHKHGYFVSSDGKSYYYRSSWEKTTLEYLDLLKKENLIESFELEPFTIEYEYDGRKYGLRIDFFIKTKNGNIILECKPLGLRNIGKNPVKIEAYQKYCDVNHIKFVLYGIEELETKEKFWESIRYFGG